MSDPSGRLEQSREKLTFEHDLEVSVSYFVHASPVKDSAILAADKTPFLQSALIVHQQVDVEVNLM